LLLRQPPRRSACFWPRQMKIDINLIDTGELEARIAERVVQDLKPLLADAGQDDDLLFSVKTLAPYLGASEEWVRDRVRYKQIPFMKVSKFLKFRKRDIDRWLDGKAIPDVNPYHGKMPRKPE